MGLDLICGTMHIRVGSYSYAHLIRIKWIKACIAFLREANPTDVLAQLLEQTCNTQIPNYRLFSDIQSDTNIFAGLKCFVDHSDCDGEWESADCIKIFITFCFIKKYLKIIDPTDFNSDTYYLEPVLKYAIDVDQKISFC